MTDDPRLAASCRHGEIETDVARASIRCRKCGAAATLAALPPCDHAAELERLRTALNTALNQWAAYADHDGRGTGWDFESIAKSTDAGDGEAELFRQVYAALAPQDTEGGAS